MLISGFLGGLGGRGGRGGGGRFACLHAQTGLLLLVGVFGVTFYEKHFVTHTQNL